LGLKTLSLLKTVKFKALFFAIYLIAILTSFFFVGATFVFAQSVKLENVLILGVLVTIGFLTPLAASNFYIENWKRNLANPNRKVGQVDTEPVTLRSFFVISIRLFILLATLIITVSSSVVCGTLFTKYFPSVEVFSPIVVGFPALIIGVGSFWVLNRLADAMTAKLEK
jgi:hypothetical protein